MTSISGISGTAYIAPIIDTSQGKPTTDQVRQDQQNNANKSHPFPNVSPEQLQGLNEEQLSRLNEYPNMTYQQVIGGHGMKGADNFIW
ncbi:hypothetical protein CI807_20640 [Pseudomonas sp. NS1(2017)]|uniref:hypothetical protein n=1 Tax=Pseudomonas sp. NS1(2017) TaxID=2025658 RepID=UPI000BA28519|nr:hypothetical protein [Pseudomonas sp. NS1(2017)]ASV38505.1 hypothetical protein CI807_20640 [Pseudomonas sp. NS1(2017)]